MSANQMTSSEEEGDAEHDADSHSNFRTQVDEDSDHSQQSATMIDRMDIPEQAEPLIAAEQAEPVIAEEPAAPCAEEPERDILSLAQMSDRDMQEYNEARIAALNRAYKPAEPIARPEPDHSTDLS